MLLTVCPSTCSHVRQHQKLAFAAHRRSAADCQWLWRDALQRCTAARGLGASDQATLRVLATQFLERKSLEPTKGLHLDDAGRVLLAAHACVAILKLGLVWFDGWHSVIVSPDALIPLTQKRISGRGTPDQQP